MGAWPGELAAETGQPLEGVWGDRLVEVVVGEVLQQTAGKSNPGEPPSEQGVFEQVCRAAAGEADASRRSVWDDHAAAAGKTRAQ